jgi:TetR/AcrR family tetracycline transcriptional repressor
MPLSREEVVQRALGLLDRVGLDALTMRRLARALGVQAGALYWHFANKQALIDAMAEAMLEGLLEPPLVGRWEAQLAELVRRAAATMLRHRDGARTAMLAIRPGPNQLAMAEKLLAILRRAGGTPRTTLWAAAAVGHFLIGYVSDLQVTEEARRSGLVAMSRALRRKLDGRAYPHLAALSDETFEAMVTGRDARARFEFGIEVLVRGLKAAKTRGRPRSARRVQAPKARRV